MKSKVVKIYEQGSPEVLKIEEIDLREIKPNEVLIKHEYAGLNFIDINQRKGTYPLKNLPLIMGMEASGRIIKTGPEVNKFEIGDKVTHCMNLGSFSSLMYLPENKVIKLKEEHDLKLAAATTLQGLTAQYLLHDSYQVKKNEFILMHAAAGGVGQLLCQWANKLGAKVIGTVTDGDIRRSLLRGYDLKDKIKNIFNKNSFYLKKKNEEKKINKIFFLKKISFIPLVKKKKNCWCLFKRQFK